MTDSKTPTPANLNAKLTGEDVLVLDRIRALACLRQWPGDWSGNRGECIRALMDKLVSMLPSLERELLDLPTPTAQVRA